MTNIPSLATIKSNILEDLTSEFDVSLNPEGLAFLTALSGVLGALFWLVYLYIANVQKNVWYDTADPEELNRWGFEILGRYPNAAVAGRYTVQATGSIGATVPLTEVFRSDDASTTPGRLFQIEGGPHGMVGVTDTFAIAALTGGTASKLVVGDTLTATAPMLNVNSSVVITAVLTAPIDAETTEQYRQKIREKVQAQQGSWNAVDYRVVGLPIVGVQQVYVYADSGAPAEVNIYLQGPAAVASPGPSVAPSVIADYAAALDLVLPTDVWEYHIVASPIKNVDVTVNRGGFPAFNPAQQLAVQNALRTFINNVKPYQACADAVADRNDLIATFNLMTVVTAAVPGRGFSGLTFTVDGTPVGTWSADNGEIPFFNSVTFA